jgi:hypothetical protein
MKIPLTAALVVGADSSMLADEVVWNGAHAEISLAALTEVCGQDLANAAVRCWERTCSLWEDLAGEAVVVQRALVRVRQTDGKNGRSDLAAELDALMSVPALAAVCEALLEQDVDDSKLVGCEVERSGNTTTVRVCVSSLEWPDALGGAPCPGETRRVFELTANHAKWRDRRVRRLQALSIDAEELWAEPVLLG